MLREIFADHLSITELPAHRFLKSIHNITIERGWLRLRLQWGDNVKLFWEAGADVMLSQTPITSKSLGILLVSVMVIFS